MTYLPNKGPVNTMNIISEAGCSYSNHSEVYRQINELPPNASLSHKIERLEKSILKLQEDKRWIESNYARKNRYLQEKASERENALRDRLSKVELELMSEKSIRKDLEISFEKLQVICKCAENNLEEEISQKNDLLITCNKLQNDIEHFKDILAQSSLLEVHLRDECHSLNLELEQLKKSQKELISMLESVSNKSEMNIIIKIFQHISMYVNSTCAVETYQKCVYDILYILYRFLPSELYVKYDSLPFDITLSHHMSNLDSDEKGLQINDASQFSDACNTISHEKVLCKKKDYPQDNIKILSSQENSVIDTSIECSQLNCESYKCLSDTQKLSATLYQGDHSVTEITHIPLLSDCLIESIPNDSTQNNTYISPEKVHINQSITNSSNLKLSNSESNQISSIIKSSQINKKKSSHARNSIFSKLLRNNKFDSLPIDKRYPVFKELKTSNKYNISRTIRKVMKSYVKN